MQDAVARIRKLSRLRPKLAIILGSGWTAALRQLRGDARLPYTEIPGFPPVGVAGHTGELIVGRLANTPVWILSGRAHFYEGYTMAEVTFAVRVLAACGVRDLLVTNAAGGINRNFQPGDFMLLSDHINFMGVNPLRGTTPAGPERFVDLSRAYDSRLGALLEAAAAAVGVPLHRGVYLAVSGPTYETPAEVQAYARLGADAVGMSTVPEVIVARQCGLRVAALSCITNRAAGLAVRPLAHREVLETSRRVGRLAAQLLQEFAKRYGKSHSR